MSDYFYVKIGSKHFQVFFSEIFYIEAKDKYVAIVTTTGLHSILHPLQIVEKILPGKLFCRIHRSYIISLLHTKWFDHNYALVGNNKLPIGKHYRDILPKRVLTINGDPNSIIGLSDYDILNFFKKIKPN